MASAAIKKFKSDENLQKKGRASRAQTRLQDPTPRSQSLDIRRSKGRTTDSTESKRSDSILSFRRNSSEDTTGHMIQASSFNTAIGDPEGGGNSFTDHRMSKSNMLSFGTKNLNLKKNSDKNTQPGPVKCKSPEQFTFDVNSLGLAHVTSSLDHTGREHHAERAVTCDRDDISDSDVSTWGDEFDDVDDADEVYHEWPDTNGVYQKTESEPIYQNTDALNIVDDWVVIGQVRRQFDTRYVCCFC